ncbi:hypothetical protein [Dactylosporangium darangshiense]|uniref:hypothetical protein n=1 Tax=Dactylosporangium darangshiense TaxID=579108 RepID=UPI003624BB9B
MNMVEDLAHAIRAAGVTPDTGRAEARDRIGGIETSVASPDGLVRVGTRAPPRRSRGGRGAAPRRRGPPRPR